MELLHFVPSVPGTIRTDKKDATGLIEIGMYRDVATKPLLLVRLNETTITQTISTKLDAEELRILGTRAMRLVSAILTRQVAVDSDLLRECWLASFLTVPVEGPLRATSDRAREIVRQHLGQDVATYLRQQEAYAA